MKIKWNALVAEATKEPIELEMPEGKPVIIETPTGEQIEAAGRLGADPNANAEQQLAILTGSDEDAKRIAEAWRKGAGGALPLLVKKITEHFYGDAAGESPTRT